MGYQGFDYANAHFITDYLAVGGDLDGDVIRASAQVSELVDRGITHVLDARGEATDDDMWDRVAGVEYRWNGIDDAGQRVPAEWFDDVAEWATEAIRSGGRVLTHCHMGINRGPSAGFAVLLAMGWDACAALSAIRAARPIAAIAYAEDAVEWFIERTDTSTEQKQAQRALVREWRRSNPLDVVRVIRSIRRGEAA